MNKLVSFTGGKPDFNIDDLLWNDESQYLSIQGLCKSHFGDNAVVYGCGISGGNVSAGYIMLDGELLRVDSHALTDTYFDKVITYDAGGDVTFNDGVARQTWQQNRATLTASSGNLEHTGVIDYAVLTKILETGDWNMDATIGINIAHGISDWTKIMRVTCIIYADTDNSAYPLSQNLEVAGDPTSPGTATVTGSINIGSVNITLNRVTSGWYDQGGWDNTSYNRGKLIIEYLS